MPTYVDSTSTYDEAVAAFNDNLSYKRTGSVEKAWAFHDACIWLLGARQTLVKSGTAQSEYDPAFLQKQLDDVKAWLSANDTDTAQTVHRGGVRGIGVAAWR